MTLLLCKSKLRVLLAFGLTGLLGAASAVDCPAILAAPAIKADLGKPLSDEAAALFKDGKFLQAAELFERAFALNPEKVVRLRNAGRAYEEAGRLEYARLLFERYLHQAPEGPEKLEVQQRLERIDEQLAAKKKEADLAERKSGESPAASPAVTPAAPGAGAPVAGGVVIAQRETNWIAWGVAGLGIGLIGGSAVWHLQVADAETKKNGDYAKGIYFGYAEGAAKLESDRAAIRLNRILAYSTLGVGIVATGVGVYWALRADTTAQIAVLPLPDASGVVVSGRF